MSTPAVTTPSSPSWHVVLQGIKNQGNMNDRQLAKTLCGFLAFVVITVCTALPIVLSKWFYDRGERGLMALRIARCFGGGAFLGAFLLHVLPEAQHMLEESLPQNYPFGTLIVGAGFFVIFFLEMLVHACVTPKKHDHGETDGKSIELNGVSGPKQVTGSGVGEGVYHTFDSDVGHKETMNCLTFKVRAQKLSDGEPPPYFYEAHHAQLHAHSYINPTESPESGSLASSAILLFALSLGCVIEGMALGIQESATGAWQMLIAILSHEFIIGFTLGLQLIRNNTKSRVLFLAIFYGLTCPIGIIIGTLISEVFAHEGNFNLVSGVCQAITGGVFIYVTFFEILADEIANNIPLGCSISLLLGFVMMVLLLMIPHEHGHGGDGHNVTDLHSAAALQSLGTWINSELI